MRGAGCSATMRSCLTHTATSAVASLVGLIFAALFRVNFTPLSDSEAGCRGCASDD